jgi:hypothetical protein
LGQDADGAFVEVEDLGVGMSKRVLKGPLLDFGVSFWRSWAVREEHPGLLGKAFEAAGKYGIGFFSVFMWGDRVRVTTRRYDAAIDDTKVLTFDAGLQSRPILRRADKDEQLQDGGSSTQFHIPLRGLGTRDVWPPLSLSQPDGRARLARTAAGVLIAAVAESWGVDLDLVLDVSGFDPEGGRFNHDPNDPVFASLESWQRGQVGERIFLIRKPVSGVARPAQ